MVEEVYSAISAGAPCGNPSHHRPDIRVLLKLNYLSEFVTKAEKFKVRQNLGLDSFKWEEILGEIPEDSQAHEVLTDLINSLIDAGIKAAEITISLVKDLEEKLEAYDAHLALPRYTKDQLDARFKDVDDKAWIGYADGIKSELKLALCGTGSFTSPQVDSIVGKVNTYLNETFILSQSIINTFLAGYSGLKLKGELEADLDPTLKNIVEKINSLKGINDSLKKLTESGITVELINLLLTAVDTIKSGGYIKKLNISDGTNSATLQGDANGETTLKIIAGDGVTVVANDGEDKIILGLDGVAFEGTGDTAIVREGSDNTKVVRASEIANLVPEGSDDSTKVVREGTGSTKVVREGENTTKVVRAGDISDVIRTGDGYAKSDDVVKIADLNDSSSTISQAITSAANSAVESKAPKFTAITQTAYNALTSKDQNTYYFIYTES